MTDPTTVVMALVKTEKKHCGILRPYRQIYVKTFPSRRPTLTAKEFGWS